MSDFYDLTNRGKARRLRKLAWAALEQYPLDVTRLRLMGNDWNCTFRVHTRDGGSYALRIGIAGPMAHPSGQFEAEVTWLAALACDTDLAIPRPLLTRSNDLFATVNVDGVPEPRHVVVTGWLPGRVLAARMTPRTMEQAGTLMAHLHQHGADWVRPADFSPFVFDSVFPFSEDMVLFEDRFADLFPPVRRAIFSQALDCAQAVIDDLKRSGQPMQPVHNDLHQWNIKVYRGRAAAIDFEDLMLGWPVQDIGTTLYYSFDHPAYSEFYAALRQGYTTVQEWPERHPGQVEAFIMARALMLCNVVLVDSADATAGLDLDTADYVARTERHLRTLLEAVTVPITDNR